jgi:hypothetical protein
MPELPGGKEGTTMGNDSDDADKRRGLVIGGLIVLGLGIFFLFAEMGWLDFIDYDMWPIILIIVGAALLVGAFIKPKKRETDKLS